MSYLSINKKINRHGGLLRLAIVGVAALLCACSQQVSTGQVDLLDAADIDVKDPSYSVVSPERTTLTQQFGATGHLVFPVAKIYSVREEARLSQVYVGSFAEVKAGDLLAELVYDQAAVQAETTLLELKRAEAVESFRLLTEQHDYTVKQMTTKMQMQHETQQRAIEKARIDHENAVYAQAALKHEQALADWQEALAEQQKRRAPIQLRADVDGYTRQVTFRKIGDIIAPGETILQVIDYSEYRVSFSADRNDFYYQMPVRVRLPKLPEMTGVVVTDPSISLWAEQELTFEVRLDEAIPQESLYNLSSMELQVMAQIPVSEDVLILPLSAVASENALRYVYLLEDNVVRKRYVKTGISTPSHVQILYGLAETDKVLKYA